MIRLLVSFLIGAVMSVGFALGGVTKPETIVQFLDFTGDWKGDVMAVMGGAVAVTFVLFRLVLKRNAPVLEAKFSLPTRRDIDTRLVVGAVLFGVGWGLIGFCPGPALASMGTFSMELFVWFAAVVAGMFLFKGFDRYLQQRAARDRDDVKRRGLGRLFSFERG